MDMSNITKADIEKTIESAILSGYIKDYPNNDDNKMIKNIKASIFSSATVWAIKEKLKGDDK